MPTQRYSVAQQPISTIFTLIREGDIAIPEIQRPFVWDATKVRNFLDSLFRGYPVGFLIAWKNPDGTWGGPVGEGTDTPENGVAQRDQPGPTSVLRQ